MQDLKGIKDSSIPEKIASVVTTRDYLITYLTMDNTTRQCPIENMTLQEFDNTNHTENGRWIVSVTKHRTDLDGHCNIAMTLL